MSHSDNPKGSQGKTQRLRVIEQPQFLKDAHLTPKGGLLANVHNAALFFKGCPELPSIYVFRWDEMLQSIVCGDGEPLTDGDVIDCRVWLEQQGLRRIGGDTVRDAIDHVARQCRFNPLTEELSGLEWDGCQRINTWLHRYLGAEDDDYHQMAGSMFLRSMIARAMFPGCKADYMLVLEGKQRTLKSTVCRILAGDKYFSDALPDLAGDAIRLSQHLRGKWLIEIPELSAISRADASRLKAFLSMTTEIYTPKYGRKEVREERRNVFMGTTNKTNYLLDETGGSRFWPVRCGDHIDIRALKRDRNQLLAEAFNQVITEKRDWWPPPELEEKFFVPQQDARYQGDGWEQPIADWDRKINDYVDGQTYRADLIPPFYLAQIADGALGLKPAQFKKPDEQKLSKCLEAMGWVRAKKTMRGRPWWPPQA